MTVTVCLDGRVLVLDGRNILELVSIAQLDDLVTALVDARSVQAAILGDEGPAASGGSSKT